MSSTACANLDYKHKWNRLNKDKTILINIISLFITMKSS